MTKIVSIDYLVVNEVRDTVAKTTSFLDLFLIGLR
jgi:hypothetical protein